MVKYRRASYGTKKMGIHTVSFETERREYEADIDILFEWDDNADSDADGNRGHREEYYSCDYVDRVIAFLNNGRIKKLNPDKLPKQLVEIMNSAIDDFCADFEGD